MTLSISTTTGSDHEVLVVLRGEVDYATAPDLRVALSAALNEHQPRVLGVDLSGVSVLDSTGIGTLVVAYRITRDLGVRFEVRNPSPFVARLFHIVGVAELFGTEVPEGLAPQRLTERR